MESWRLVSMAAVKSKQSGQQSGVIGPAGLSPVGAACAEEVLRVSGWHRRRETRAAHHDTRCSVAQLLQSAASRTGRRQDAEQRKRMRQRRDVAKDAATSRAGLLAQQSHFAL